MDYEKNVYIDLTRHQGIECNDGRYDFLTGPITKYYLILVLYDEFYLIFLCLNLNNLETPMLQLVIPPFIGIKMIIKYITEIE